MGTLGGRKEIVWTAHARFKMRHYRLSEQKIRNVIHSPKRIEQGIAPGTLAFLKQEGNAKKPHEIWVMIADGKTRRRIISAWRYPGITKPGEPLPEEIMVELEGI